MVACIICMPSGLLHYYELHSTLISTAIYLKSEFSVLRLKLILSP